VTRRRRGRDERGAVPVAGLVADLLAKAGVQKAVREHRLVTEWEQIVGERVAARAWPDGLSRGVLYVRVTNSAWMHELAFLKEAMIAAARRVTGDPPVVKEVRFHVGARRSVEADDPLAELAARRPGRGARPAARPPVSAREAQVIDRETERVGDPGLREAIRAAWRRLPAAAK
jgi:predicted nucleic acid-binding Zn ribbon protein